MLEESKFRLSPELLTRPVRVLLIGAGGNGSQMLPGLARLHMTMIALGHPGGIDVHTVDGDTVSQSNVGRQLFYRADVGQPKAILLTHRVNQCYGLAWTASFSYVDEASFQGLRYDLVIGCVDTRQARRSIHAGLYRHSGRSPALWLDLGNDAYTGQCILGEAPVFTNPNRERTRLPVVTEFFPDLLDAATDAEAEKNTSSSCSLAEAIEKQSTFVNQMCATHALNMLSNLFRFGVIDHSAVFFNTRTSQSTALPVCVKAWSRFGISRPVACA